MNPKQLGAVAGASLLIVGSLLDWVTVQTVFGSIGVGGMDGDGPITLIVGIIALGLFLAVKKRAAAITASVFCAIGGAVAVYDFINVKDEASNVSNEFARASVGIGLYVCIIGAGLGLVAGILWSNDLKASEAASVPTTTVAPPFSAAPPAPPAPSGSPLPPPPPPTAPPG